MDIELTKEQIMALPIVRVTFGFWAGQDFYFNQCPWLAGNLYSLTTGEFISKIDNQYLDTQPEIIWELVQENAKMPKYNPDDHSAAGMDLYCPVDVTIPARSKVNIKLGIKSQIPYGHYMKIEARSGTSWKNCLEVGAGVIDSSYSGEWGLVLYNHSDIDYEVEPGDRIAQAILLKYNRARNVLGITSGNRGGFGSSGK